jgi:hypothetical protein
MARAFEHRREPTDDVELFWRPPDELTIQAKRAIYFFRKKGSRAILYIGKADRQTVKKRLACRSKDRLWTTGGGEKIVLRPFVAGLYTRRRVTPSLIDDVERLLIFFVSPSGNGPGKASCRLHHRDLVVRCYGDWPQPRKTFSYSNDFPFSLTYASE